jgi:hypothetical protein
MPNRKEAMTEKNTFQSVIPPTPAEVAVAAAGWEQRGILGRLVRLDDKIAPAEEQRRAGRTARPAVAPASRSI